MPSPSNDSAKRDRSGTGSVATFEELVRVHRSAVYGYLRARLTSSTDALRLTESTFARCDVDGLGEGHGDAIRQRLLEIATTLLSEHVQRKQHTEEADWTRLCLDVEGSGNAVDDQAWPERITECLQNLEPAEREAIELVYHGGRTPSQVGERLRRSESAVRQLLFRARQKLQEGLLR